LSTQSLSAHLQIRAGSKQVVKAKKILLASNSLALWRTARRSLKYPSCSCCDAGPNERRPNALGPRKPAAMLPTPKHDEAARELHVEDEVPDDPRHWVNAPPQPWSQKAGDQAANRHRQSTKSQNWPTWQNSRHSNKIFLKSRHVGFSSYVNACSYVEHRNITAASFYLLVAEEVQHGSSISVCSSLAYDAANVTSGIPRRSTVIRDTARRAGRRHPSHTIGTLAANTEAPRRRPQGQRRFHRTAGIASAPASRCRISI
jgi:hypothetical protein